MTETTPTKYTYPYKKTVFLRMADYLGTGIKNCAVEVDVCLEKKEKGVTLSVRGHVWKPRHDDVFEGGQCSDTIKKLFPCDVKVTRIVEVWKRWHLNNLNAGCEHQRAAGWGAEGWGKDKKNGIEAVLGKSCPECGYKYGIRWLHEELPPGIEDEVRSW